MNSNTMNSDRTPSAMTLALVRQMAENPASHKRLRAFHARQLRDLERRASLAKRPRRPNPFDRFERSLETERQP